MNNYFEDLLTSCQSATEDKFFKALLMPEELPKWASGLPYNKSWKKNLSFCN